MHPEIVTDEPGSCPKCGMALIPMPEATPRAAEYTCFMHPEIVRDGPGSCPKRLLLILAERVGADTLLARIVHMVGEAQRTHVPIQRLADVIAAWFVQIVVAIAIVTALAWWFLVRSRDLHKRS